MEYLGYVGAPFENHQYSLIPFSPSPPPGFFLGDEVKAEMTNHENPTYTWFSHLGRHLYARKLLPDLLKEKARWNSWLRFAPGQKEKRKEQHWTCQADEFSSCRCQFGFLLPSSPFRRHVSFSRGKGQRKSSFCYLLHTGSFAPLPSENDSMTFQRLRWANYCLI